MIQADIAFQNIARGCNDYATCAAFLETGGVTEVDIVAQYAGITCLVCTGGIPLAHVPIAHVYTHCPVLRVFPLDHQSENFILN